MPLNSNPGNRREALTLAAQFDKESEKQLKRGKRMAQQTKELNKLAEQGIKISEASIEALLERNQALTKVVDTNEVAIKAMERTNARARAAAEALGKDYKGGVEEAKENLRQLFTFQSAESLKARTGMSNIFDRLDEALGVTRTHRELTTLTTDIQAMQEKLLTDPDLTLDERLDLEGSIQLAQIQLDHLNKRGFAPILEQLWQVRQRTHVWLGETVHKLGPLATAVILQIGKGIWDNINLIDDLQERMKYANVGFRETLNYVRAISDASSRARGLIDPEGAAEAFELLTSRSREFTKTGSSLTTTLVKLHAGLGISYERAADLAFQMKTLGVGNVDRGMRQASDAMAFFAKNTSLTTSDIEEMMDASRDLYEIFPQRLEDRLIPQLLGVAAAIKDIGVSAAAAAKDIQDMSSLRNSKGMFKAAMVSATGGQSFGDVLGGKDVGASTAALAESVRSMVQSMSNGDPALFNTMAESVAEMYGMDVSQVRRYANMNKEAMQSFKDRIKMEQDYAKQQGALDSSIEQQLSGPMNAVKSVWEQFKLLTLNIGNVAVTSLRPVWSILGALLRGVSVGFQVLNKVLTIASEGIGYLYDALTPLGEWAMDAAGWIVKYTTPLGRVMKSFGSISEGVGFALEYAGEIMDQTRAEFLGYIADIIEGVNWAANNWVRGMDMMINTPLKMLNWMLGKIPAPIKKMLGLEDVKIDTDPLGIRNLMDPFAGVVEDFRNASNEFSRSVDRQIEDRLKAERKGTIKITDTTGFYDPAKNTALQRSLETDAAIASAWNLPVMGEQAVIQRVKQPVLNLEQLRSDIDYATQVPVEETTLHPKAPLPQEYKTQETPEQKPDTSSDQTRRYQQLRADDLKRKERMYKLAEEATRVKLLPMPFDQISLVLTSNV
jgi:hypothetical protein